MENSVKKGNVLVIGNSGVGKSTLINAVLGENKATVGWGTSGTTKDIATYENDFLPFRLVDTAGLESTRAIVDKLSKLFVTSDLQKDCIRRATDGEDDTNINVIWYCVDGVSSKLFPEAIKELLADTAVWKSVPIIAVVTKSYSTFDCNRNIIMVNEAFDKAGGSNRKLRGIFPVVADTFEMDDCTFVTPYGISDLVQATNDFLPEGKKAAAKDVALYVQTSKNTTAQKAIGTSAAAAAAVGAIPFTFPDALILSPIEVNLMKQLSKIYEIPKSDARAEIVNMIINMGTVGVVAKAAINAIKAIPGIRFGAAVLNAVVAGSIVTALGECCVKIFEAVYRGEKTLDDINWAKNIIESEATSRVLTIIQSAASQLDENSNLNDLKQVFFDIMKQLFAQMGEVKEA